MASIKTPVSLLQEIFARQNKSLPIYQEVPTDSFAYPFKCKVQIENITAYGYATTKKEAKHNCAQEALNKLGVGSASDFQIKKSPTLAERANERVQNYVGQLNEHASGNQLPYPTYCDKLPQGQLFVIECEYIGLTTVGTAPNKKNAKRQASKFMLEKLKEVDIDCKKYQVFKQDDSVDDIDHLLKRYEQLSIVNEDRSLVPNPEMILVPKCEKFEVGITLDGLMGELRELGHLCKKEVMQRDPYIVVLKIDGNSSAVLGLGNNMEEANNDLLLNSKIMFDDGFSFMNSLKRM